MNKKILALIVVFVVLLIILLIILANKKTTDQGEVTPTSSSDQVNLIWWNLFEPIENVQPLIDAFEKENPNINIQYSQVGKNGIDEYRSELEESLIDEDVVTSPDIFPLHNTWVGKFEKYLIKAPASVISSSELDQFYAVVRRDFYRSSSIYGLPMSLDTIAIIYNKTKLKEKGYQAPALTWNDFQTQAKNLTKKDSNNNIVFAGFSAFDPDTSEFYFEVMNQMFMQNDVKILESSGTRSNISDDENAQGALEYYRDFLKGTGATWEPLLKKDIAAFLEGNLAMYAAPSWRLINVLDYNSYYDLNLDIGVASMPQLSGGGEYYWPTYWGLSVSKDSQYSTEAWKFIKFITEEEQLELYNETVKKNGRPIGILYPRLSLAAQNQSDSYLKEYSSSLAKAQSWDMKDGWALENEFDKMFKSNPSIDSIEASINKVLNEVSSTPTP